MLKFKKILSAIIAVQVIVLTLFVSVPAQAKSRYVAKPKLVMATKAKTSYKIGEKVSFSVYSPNYKGKVVYRAVLTNVKTKKQMNLVNTPKTGYYNLAKPVAGNAKYAVSFPLSGIQPGTYNVTVLVKRAGFKTSLDSYVRTQNFTVAGPNVKLSTNYYTSTEGNFKIKFPALWETEEISDDIDGQPLNMAIAAPKGKDNPVMMVISTPTASGDTLESGMDTLKEELLNEMSGTAVKFTELSRRKVTVDGQAAYLVEYSLVTKVNGVNTAYTEAALVTLNDKMSNVVVLVTTSSDWSLNSSIYRQAIQSFIPVIAPAQEQTDNADNNTPAQNTENNGATTPADNNAGNETTTTPTDNNAGSGTTTTPADNNTGNGTTTIPVDSSTVSETTTTPVSNATDDETAGASSSSLDTSAAVQAGSDSSQSTSADTASTADSASNEVAASGGNNEVTNGTTIQS